MVVKIKVKENGFETPSRLTNLLAEEQIIDANKRTNALKRPLWRKA